MILKIVCDNCQKRGCRTFCFRCNKRFYCNKKCKEEHEKIHKEKCDDDIERTVRITKMSIEVQFPNELDKKYGWDKPIFLERKYFIGWTLKTNI